MRYLSILILFTNFAWAATETPVKIALNWKPEPQFGGFYAAQVLGLDRKEGLQLSLLEGGSGTPTVQMLAHGQVDFAVVSAEEILISNERNPQHPVQALFAVYSTNPQMIMCHLEKGFRSLQEVFQAPITLAWQSGLTYAQFLKAKYPAAKARFVPYQGGVSTFLADSGFCQQGFLTSEPIAAEKSGAKVKPFLVADEGFNPYTTVLTIRSETYAKQPALVDSVVRAVRAGWKAYVKDPMATNQAMHKLNSAMDLDTFAKSATAQIPLVDPEGKMTKERWQALAATLNQLKVTKAADAEKAYPTIK